LAIVVFFTPKVGAASDLAIKIPDANTEEWYLRSVNHTVDEFGAILRQIGAEPKAHVSLTNIDLDTGDRVKRGDYALADQTYARLLARITSRPERTIPADLRQNIIEYYSGESATQPVEQQVGAQLNVLKGMKATDGLEEQVK
jgi:hypothetical protein